MYQLMRKTVSILMVAVLIIGCAPCLLQAHATEVVETLDLLDTDLFNVIGTNVITKLMDADGNVYYEFRGGGVSTYNKIITKKVYSGNIELTYDIQFESTDSGEMILTTPRGTFSSDTSKTFPNSLTSNFVLHTASTCGQRLSYTNNSGSNISGRAATDSTMTNYYNNQMTSVWYTVKIVLSEDNYFAKFWPAETEEPSAYNCTLSAANTDLAEGVIGFAKRGSGKVLLRNVQVACNQPDESETYSNEMTFLPDSDEWIHNEAGIFAPGIDGEDSAIILGGGGNNQFNKIITSTVFSGDMCMEFEVNFSSSANEEMLKFTPRMDPISTNTAAYSGVCGNFVLHTTDSKGLRLSNQNNTVVTDKSISNKNMNPTNTWYTVKFEIVGNTYQVKFWPSGNVEPSGWMCTYTFSDAPASGPIAFMKRGTGTLQLKNVRVRYNTISLFRANTVGSINPMTVAYNTDFGNIELPASVNVLGDNNVLRRVDVTWNEASYSQTTTGVQTIVGTLELTEDENPYGLNAVVEINVLPEGAIMQTSVIISYGEKPDIVTYHQFGTIVTKTGTILATCEARVGGADADNPSSIVLWRSTDGGKNWSNTITVADYAENKCSDTENNCGKGIYGHFYANPTPVVDYETGKIYLFYSENFSNVSTKVYYRSSVDDGITWSDPVEVTNLFADDPYGRAFHLPGPGHGLQIENGEYTGRLVVEVWHRHSTAVASTKRQYGLSVLYSDDGGTTWNNSEYISVGYNMNEGRVAQLAGGALVINSRSTDNTRKQTYSYDGGVTWSTPSTWSSIGNYANCDSGFTSQVDSSGTILITTRQYNTSNRDNLYAFLSYDNGATWTCSAKLWSETLSDRGTGASDVNRIMQDTFGAIHGTSWNNNDVEYVVFNIPYLIGGF